MDALLNNIWIQAGSLGLLAASGWIVAYVVNKERRIVQDKRDYLLEQLLTFMHEQKDVIEKISDSLAFQQVLKDEISKLRDK